MKTARGILLALGSAVMLYGAWLVLSRQDPGQWLEVALWLGGGVVAHDLVVSGLVIGACALGARLLPAPWRAPAVIALVVWGGLTIASIPVLSGLGVRADNPTLLDRPYVATWWTISAIVVAAVVVAGLVRSRPRTVRAREKG
jgi:hypothetical protein